MHGESRGPLTRLDPRNSDDCVESRRDNKDELDRLTPPILLQDCAIPSNVCQSRISSLFRAQRPVLKIGGEPPPERSGIGIRKSRRPCLLCRPAGVIICLSRPCTGLSSKVRRRVFLDGREANPRTGCWL